MTRRTEYGNRAIALVALVGLIIFSAMAGYGLAERTRHIGPQVATEALTGAKQSPSTSPSRWTPPCTQPNDRERCDLEAQWYAAQATRESANLAFWQLWIGIIGAIALGLTLYFNVKATRAAARATLASEGALQHAQEMAYRQLRAYVTFGVITVRREGNEFFFQIPILNTGQTPAVSVVLRSYARLLDYPFYQHDLTPLNEANAGQVFDLMPQAERGWTYFFSLKEEEEIALDAGEKAFFMRLQISYTTYNTERIDGPVTDWVASRKELVSGRFAVPSPQCYSP